MRNGLFAGRGRDMSTRHFLTLLDITGGGKVVRMLPPLIMSDTEADLLVNTVSRIIKVYMADD